MVALIATYLACFLCIYLALPIEIFTFLIFLTLLIPFALAIMLLTDNPLYKKIKSMEWANAAKFVFLATYSAVSYVWASSEVNSIFIVSPGNLPWSITILTVVYFFKNIVLTCALLAFVFIFFYVNIWLQKVFIKDYKNIKTLIKDIGSGVAIVLGIGLLIGSSARITLEKEKVAKLVALKADFNSSHSCKGEQFENSSGVLFLPSGKVLIAKPILKNGQTDWSFDESVCNE